MIFSEYNFLGKNKKLATKFLGPATVFEVKSNLTVSNLLIALTVILVHLENLSKALYDCQILLQSCQAHIREVVNAEEKIKDNC